MSSCFRKNICQFLSPELMFRSNQMSPKYSTAPQFSQVFTSKGLGREGRGQFQGVRRSRQQAFCSCGCPSCTRMAGWVGLVRSSDVIPPAFGFVPTLAQPTGSSASVSQPLSRSLSPLHVCLCVFCAGLLLICSTHAPPRPPLFSGDMNFGSNEL